MELAITDFSGERWTPQWVKDERARALANIPPMLFLSLDLGQANDYTAKTIIQCHPTQIQVRYIERIRGTPYPQIVADTAKMLEDERLAGATLLLDYTGVGRPVFDMFRVAKVHGKEIKPIGITIHGGNNVTPQPNGYGVPKRDLVYSLVSCFQHGFVHLPERNPNTPILVGELTNFQMKRNAQTGHDSYAAAREGDHDDLVLSLAQSVWYYQRVAKRGARTARLISGR